ncbi:MAG: hypothetical protein ACR2I2_02250 [Bryobacteraceae bacterium]
MPPGNKTLSKEQVPLIREWIDAGRAAFRRPRGARTVLVGIQEAGAAIREVDR